MITIFEQILSYVVNFKNTYFLWSDLPDVTVTDVLEILIIAFLFYHVLVWVKNTRAWNLVKGLLVIVLFVLVAAILQMNTILWLAERTFSVGLVALVVIFQPELRRALEDLGQKQLLSGFINFNNEDEKKFSDKTVNEIVKACYEMGKDKTGALIVIENHVGLTEYERTGIPVDAIVSSQLLLNIFEKNTPLHDGAVIVRGDRVISATCYLPLSDNMQLSKELGTRHRAAVGVSEVTDSMTIVVSEENGKVSLAVNGVLYRNVDADFLKGKLTFLQNDAVKKPEKGNRFIRRFRHVKENR